MVSSVYATADRCSASRLVLISYHFPPDTAEGALRWQKLARYAAERGWGLDVITRDPDLSERDPLRVTDLPAGVRVYCVPAPGGRATATTAAMWRTYRRVGNGNGQARSPRRESPARGEVAWPAREIRDVTRAYRTWRDYARARRWARDVARHARELLRPGVHRAVVTCGPPHMVHEAGRRVARDAGLPLVMDLRDPWSRVQCLPEPIASRLWLTLAARDERAAVHQASLVIANTDSLCVALRHAYPSAICPIIAVPNGCDDDALAARGSAVELLLRGSGADVVGPEDEAAVAGRLRARFDQYRRGERPTRLATDSRFSRRAMADRMFDALETVVCAAS